MAPWLTCFPHCTGKSENKLPALAIPPTPSDTSTEAAPSPIAPLKGIDLLLHMVHSAITPDLSEEEIKKVKIEKAIEWELLTAFGKLECW